MMQIFTCPIADVD